MNNNDKFYNKVSKFHGVARQVLDMAWQSLQENVGKIPKGKTYESLLAGLWIEATFNGVLCLHDLLTYDQHYLQDHQRTFYFQVRFCIETFSTLKDVKDKPDQIAKFYDGFTLYEESLEKFKAKNYKKSAEQLRKIGNIDSRFVDRVAGMYPDLLPAYALICWHCHPHFIGQLFEMSENCVEETFHNLSSALAKILPQALELLNGNSIIRVSDTLILEFIQNAQDVIDSDRTVH